MKPHSQASKRSVRNLGARKLGVRKRTAWPPAHIEIASEAQALRRRREWSPPVWQRTWAEQPRLRAGFHTE